MPHINVVWTDQVPVTVRAAMNGYSTIWMSRGLVQRERRSSLAHELEHVRRGRRGCLPPPSRTTSAATRHAGYCPTVPTASSGPRGVFDVAAEELWVDTATVRARIDVRWLHPAERAYLRRRIAEAGQQVTIRKGCGLLVRFLAYTGRRWGEMAALHIASPDLPSAG